MYTNRSFERACADTLRRHVGGEREPVVESVTVELRRGHALLLDKLCRQSSLARSALVMRALEVYAVSAGLGADVERARRML